MTVPATSTRDEVRTRGGASPRWILVAAVLGSGAVFLEGTVVNVAMPAIGREFSLGMSGLQWVMNAYLLSLTALMLLGGSLGDRYGRASVFQGGALGFAVATAACAVAPGPLALFLARAIQGAAGAMLVPNSLAMLGDAYSGEERSVAIGRWAAWSAVSTAVGPLLGGSLADASSWRWVFAVVIPFALVAAWMAWRHRAACVANQGKRHIPVDYAGAALVSLGLAGVVTGLIAGPGTGFDHPPVVAALGLGTLMLAGFGLVEAHKASPLLPLDVFRSRQFTGTNLTTLLVYASLSGLFFLLMLVLQNGLGYGALAAGASLLPVNVLMLALSPRMGRLAERIGPRWPMTVGAAVAALGMLLFARMRPASEYLSVVLPATVVFGLGLSMLVTPLTSAALGAVGEGRKGLASGLNNAVARLAGLLATASIPAAAGLGGLEEVRGEALTRGFVRAMWICAVLCVLGSLVAWRTVDDGRRRS
jgi:EmrB/QacA subfamily drug resistance transporter